MQAARQQQQRLARRGQQTREGGARRGQVAPQQQEQQRCQQGTEYREQEAQAEGRGEVISTPRVITANQREAIIQQGVEIPYQESASSGATTISFKEAVLELRVTPQVTPDNRIILDLNIKKDSVGQIIVGGAGQQVPSIDTREITTQVLVNDGQTVVLGGILETERRETEKKVPYLGDVPVLGRLFKTTGRTNNKDELLIFVTPKILREGVNVY